MLSMSRDWEMTTWLWRWGEGPPELERFDLLGIVVDVYPCTTRGQSFNSRNQKTNT